MHILVTMHKIIGIRIISNKIFFKRSQTKPVNMLDLTPPPPSVR